MYELRTAATAFGAALADAFVRHSVLIFVALSLLFLALYGMVSDVGRPVDTFPAPATVPFFDPLRVILIVAFYGLVALLIGVLIWVGIPALIVSFVVSVSKLAKWRNRPMP